MTILRPYQTEVIAEVESAGAAGQRRIIVVAPTGSGKTIIAAELIKRAVADGKYVLVIAHRREIITQTSRKLHDLGISHGIIQAGFPERPMAHVQVASVQTLHTRAILVRIAEERGYKPGWAAHKFRERFGDWPQSRYVMPIEPTPEVRSWVRSRMIAYAKARAAA